MAEHQMMSDGRSASVAIDRLDTETALLIQRRSRLAASLPQGGAGAGSAFPSSFRVREVVELYVEAFGSPGELVARAVLNAGLADLPAEPGDPDQFAQEIDRIDREIIALLARRFELVRELPRKSVATSPRIDEVVTAYRRVLGSPGELVARSVINVMRART